MVRVLESLIRNAESFHALTRDRQRLEIGYDAFDNLKAIGSFCVSEKCIVGIRHPEGSDRPKHGEPKVEESNDIDCDRMFTPPRKFLS